MTRPTLREVLCGCATAVVLVAVGGCGGGAVDEASDIGAAAEPAEPGVPNEDGNGGEDTGGDDDGDDGGDDGARPGQPGEVDTDGGGGRAGTPYDQPVFTDVGRPLDADAIENIEGRCADDVCTIAYSFKGEPDDPPANCTVSGFSYDSGERDGYFQAGAVVTVAATCRPSTPEEGTTEEGTVEEGTVEEGTTEEEEVPEEEVTEEGTTEEEVPEEETTEGETTEDTGG